MYQKRSFWIGVMILVVILGICFVPWRSKPILVEQTAVPTDSEGFILLKPIIFKEDPSKIQLGDNLPSNTDYQNTSFEYLIYDQDKFAYDDGYRPFPWGGEVFRGKVSFRNSLESHSERNAYKIVGLSPDSQGVLAVPDIELKPVVIPGEIYYLSFWIQYNIKEGKGVRLMQQFFIKGDYYYPSYVCYGPWLKGKCDGWIHIGMLVRAPKNAWKGDPVIEIYGKGELIIDDAYFGKATISY